MSQNDVYHKIAMPFLGGADYKLVDRTGLLRPSHRLQTSTSAKQGVPGGWEFGMAQHHVPQKYGWSKTIPNKPRTIYSIL